MSLPAVSVVTVLPPLAEQAERLISLGLIADPDALRAEASRLATATPVGSLLVLHERVLPASKLAHLMQRPAPGRAGAAGEVREGFVVEDMTDVDEFVPTMAMPGGPYVVRGLDRGDEFASVRPADAVPVIEERGRSPLTLVEGLHWAIQDDGVLERNHCYMTIGSRKQRANGTFDARTPALWISNGTGRDGRERKGAPKVGWCWWRNHHTWLGIASCAARSALQPANGGRR